MNGLITLRAEAKVFDDRMLGIKLPVDLDPGTYEAVVVLARHGEPATPVSDTTAPVAPLAEHMERERKAHIQRALDASGGNRSQAARLLGVDVRSVFRHLAEDKE